MHPTFGLCNAFQSRIHNILIFHLSPLTFYSNLSYNVQFLHMLKSPNDAWTRVVRKVASDVVHRIFNSFSNEQISAEQRLTKKLFICCFLRGKSTTDYLKGITKWSDTRLEDKVCKLKVLKPDTHAGRQIVVKNSQGETEKYFSSHLFLRPNAFVIKDKQCFSNSEEHKNPEFMFRHCFEHELESCVHPIHLTSTGTFLTVDQQKTLLQMKEKVEKELAHQFMSSHDKIILTMREVLAKEFEKSISSSSDKTNKKIDLVSEQIGEIQGEIQETAGQIQETAHIQENMLSRIYMRLKRLEGSNETD